MHRPLSGLFIPVMCVSAALLLCVGQSKAQVEGHWEGQIVRDGALTAFELDIKRLPGGFAGSFSLPEQRVLEYPLQGVSLTGNQVVITGPGGAFRCAGTLSGSTLSGTFSESAGDAVFRAAKVARTLPYTSEELRFRNGSVTLAGSLYVPRYVPRGARHQFPAVVFLHGAGGEVRWGASRYFADYFARRGIAALIYDKRGSGESSGDWHASTLEDLSGDALAAVDLLRLDPRIDPKRIGLYGHSQGGTLTPLVATTGATKIAFVISAAGAAVPMWKAEVHSLRTQVRAQGVTGESLARADAFIDRFVSVARTGQGFDELSADADRAKKEGEPWAKLLAPPSRTSYFWSFYRGIADFDAAQHWRKLTVPVLIIEAGKDRYVPVEDSIREMSAALRMAHNPDFTILVLPGAPHNLVLQPGDEPLLKWPQLYPGYADLLVAWILQRFGHKGEESPKAGTR